MYCTLQQTYKMLNYNYIILLHTTPTLINSFIKIKNIQKQETNSKNVKQKMTVFSWIKDNTEKDTLFYINGYSHTCMLYFNYIAVVAAS